MNLPRPKVEVEDHGIGVPPPAHMQDLWLFYLVYVVYICLPQPSLGYQADQYERMNQNQKQMEEMKKYKRNLIEPNQVLRDLI